MHPYISSDESYIIFGVSRPSEIIDNVLFFSYKEENGNWSDPKEINLGMKAGQPHVTPDGKYLFFTSGEQGAGEIYWVSTKIIEEFK